MQKLKIKYNSKVILTFAILSFFVLVLNFITVGYTNKMFFCVYRAELSFLSFIRLFTHILGHTDISHYFNNFLLILITAPMIEERYGSRLTFCFIIITAFITGILHIIISDKALLGASGIAFMFIGLASFTNIEKNKVPLTTILVIFMCLGKELSFLGKNDNISRITHIVGGICGLVIGVIVNYKRRKNYVKNRNRRIYI